MIHSRFKIQLLLPFTLVFALSCPASELFNDTTVIQPAGKNYKKNVFREMLFGFHYRKVWMLPISVPVLNLENQNLHPVKKGGSRETFNLRLVDEKGREYVIRSVDKDLSKALPHRYQHTFIGGIFRDQVSANHPYACLVVAGLEKSAGIPHPSPKLFVIPNDSALGQFREEFKGMMVTLEERPDNSWKKDSLFNYAKKFIGTEELLRLRYDSLVSFDTLLYLKIRLLDMLVGDWSRHADQYRWGIFKEGPVLLAQPVPRDRDHAFYKNDGMLNKLALLVFSAPQSFKKKLKNVKSLNSMGRRLDDLILSGVPEHTWIEVSENLVNILNDETIDQAVNLLPKEVMKFDGNEIAEKLKLRRNKLKPVSLNYFKIINKSIMLGGTSHDDLFKITFTENKNVKIEIIRLGRGDEDQILFSGIFEKGITKKITLLGLEGKDTFEISGDPGRKNTDIFIDRQTEDVINNQAKNFKPHLVKGSKFQRSEQLIEYQNR